MVSKHSDGDSVLLLPNFRRLRRGTEESLREARERLRKQDQRIIAECREIVARSRRGEYVSEEDLEYAFRELETRMS